MILPDGSCLKIEIPFLGRVGILRRQWKLSEKRPHYCRAGNDTPQARSLLGKKLNRFEALSQGIPAKLQCNHIRLAGWSWWPKTTNGGASGPPAWDSSRAFSVT